jgi:hypothetical protein
LADCQQIQIRIRTHASNNYSMHGCAERSGQPWESSAVHTRRTGRTNAGRTRVCPLMHTRVCPEDQAARIHGDNVRRSTQVRGSCGPWDHNVAADATQTQPRVQVSASDRPRRRRPQCSPLQAPTGRDTTARRARAPSSRSGRVMAESA